MSAPAGPVLQTIHRLRRHAKDLAGKIEQGPRLLKAFQNALVKQEELLKQGHDALGIQAKANEVDLDFEAGWSPEGAVCVRHVRVKDKASLDALEASLPRLRGRTGAVCAEAFARSLGATLFNRSPN